jgi:hypothetical protein
MPSRQERRRAERDAAKRAPVQAGAAGAGGAAAARVNVVTSPVGDWTTQAEDPIALFRALGPDIVKQNAAAGDREALWSLGYQLVSDADGAAGKLGTGGRSPQADVGFPLAPHSSPVPTRMRRVDVADCWSKLIFAGAHLGRMRARRFWSLSRMRRVDVADC